MRKKYDTAVIFLYAVGKENLLPADFRSKIPYTTISKKAPEPERNKFRIGNSSTSPENLKL